MKNKAPEPNALDRAIRAISPSWALKRHQNRVALALTGGYSGAGYRDNMAYYRPGAGDADSDTISDLRELRSRSRDLVRNSPIAGGAIETQVSHIVGTGLTLQSHIDAGRLGMEQDAAAAWQSDTEAKFRMWASSEYADASDEQNFYELQDLAFRSQLESGDCFVVLASKNRQNWPFPLALQVIEADRVCNKDWGQDTQTLVSGIIRDAAGAPVSVQIADRHPGTRFTTSGVKWTTLDFRGRSGRRNVLHLKRKLRPGQTRGVPALAPIIEPLKQLTRYSQAEVDAAVNSAAFSIFTKIDPEVFGEIFDEESQKAYMDNAKGWDGSPTTGKVVNLMPGEEIETASMNRPNPNFDPFVSAVMRQIGIGLNIPYEVLTKHFQSSYSAARAALLDAWRTFKIRREWLASKLCQPVYEEWLADAVASGLVVAPGFFADPMVRAAWCAATWTGDGPGSIDPLKEANAVEKRLQIGLTTLSEEVTAYDGGDWYQKHGQQVVERQEREEGGLIAPLVMPTDPAAGDTPPQPPESEDDDESPTDMATAAVLDRVVAYLKN